MTAKRTFAYKSFEVGATEMFPKRIITYRAILEARMSATNGKSVQVTAQADSGADTCLFPLGVLGPLGLNLRDMPKALTGGIGSQVYVTYYAPVVLDFGMNFRFDILAGFTPGA